MRVRYRAQALSDIDAIEAYLKERSPNGARAVLRAIFDSIQSIANQPMAYVATDAPGIRVHVVNRYRYRIFYSYDGDVVEIIHIRHGARRDWRPP